jgi:outer membrane lipoprotein-sorting protein
MHPMRNQTRPDPLAALRIALLAICLVAAAPAGAAGFDLPALMQQLAQTRSGQAVFVEDRRVQQLEQTLRSSGRLSFTAPDTFVRETLKPSHERLAVVGNQLTMSRGSRSRTAMLDSVPEAAVIVEAIRGTLTGNRQTLERYFDISVQGSAEQWQLDLAPREPRLRMQVSHLRLSGGKGQVREVRMMLADGDTSVMRIEPVSGDAPAKP